MILDVKGSGNHGNIIGGGDDDGLKEDSETDHPVEVGLS